MLAVLDGVVTALEPSGFRVLNTHGVDVLVTTMTDGRRLALAVGQTVRVYGGPDQNGDHASSEILRFAADGSEIVVADAPAR